MRFRIPQITACLVVLLLSCFVVTRSQQVAPVASPTPSPAQSPVPVAPPAPAPEQKAYDEARRIKDPQKKIEALEKVVKDFPDKVVAFQARNDVLDAYIKSFPTQTDKIRAAAEKIFEPSKVSPLALGSSYLNVATKLMDAGLMLDWAEELSTKGSAMYEDELAKNIRRQRARGQDTLGRIYLKQGKTKQAKTYLKLALTNDPELSSSMIGLGTIAESTGDHKTAVEYFTSAAVKTPLKKADRQLMETAYRAMHQDSLTGLEDLLDSKYRKLNAGLHFDHYQTSTKRTSRTALAELFTGSGCGPCVAADLGFDGLLERYKRQDLVVLIYHLHIPLPDPMTNPATVDRGKYYGVPGTPTPVVDGFRLPSAGGSRDMTKGFYDRVNPKIESELELAAQAQIAVTGVIAGDIVKANVVVDQIKAPSPDLKLQIALTEDEVRYTGENGVRFHPMVVRSLGGKEANGFALSGSGPTTIEWAFDLKAMSDQLKKYLDGYEQQGHRGDPFTFLDKKYQIDPNNLSLVAFVQDMKTKQVLQTVYLKLSPAATASATAAVQ
ncbi:MAG TPA: tetratricopeptide repeat protein [Pyrinomonadaceae bacterium]|jgi:tetratricopeptide (TPR) repeat protein